MITRPEMGLRRTTAWIALATLAIGLGVGPVFVSAGDDALPASIRLLESKHELVKNNLLELVRRKAALHEDVRRLAADIDRLQSQGELSFLDRRRLERLQAESLEAGSRLENLAAQVDRKQAEYDESRANLYRVYSEEMHKSAEALAAEKRRGAMIDQAQLFIRLAERRKLYAPKETQVADTDFLGIAYTADEPTASLRSKRDLLFKRRERLREAMANVQKEIQALRNDKALADQMRNLVIQEQLFEDGVVFSPGPRTAPSRTDESGTDVNPSNDAEGQSGVHISPLDTPDGDPAAAEAAFSIEDEIRRLQKLLEYMKGIEARLNRQIEDIERFIKNAERQRPTLERDLREPQSQGQNR